WRAGITCLCAYVFTCLRWCVIVRAYPDLWFCRYFPGCYRGACPAWKVKCAFGPFRGKGRAGGCADVFTCLRWCVIVRAYPDLWFCRYSPGCYRGACPSWKDSNARWASLGVRGDVCAVEIGGLLRE